MEDLEARVIKTQFQIFIADRFPTMPESATTAVVANSAPWAKL